MIAQRCVLVQAEKKYRDVWLVEVPSFYCSPKGSKPLPPRMALLYKPAALALDAAMIEIAAAGGHLFITDMFRSREDQEKAHQDYLSGRKKAYSPPPGGSMHEAGRAIDIDPDDTIIGLAKVKTILAKHGWIGIADKGSECWHHDWRGPDGEAAYRQGGAGMSRYRAMARRCIEAIQNPSTDVTSVNRVVEIQKLLNQIWPGLLAEDGIYGPRTRDAVIVFQKSKQLTPDGVVGPITFKVLQECGGHDVPHAPANSSPPNEAID